MPPSGENVMTEPRSEPTAIAILGPTASGKTALAEALADRLQCSIINADVFQMYRGFDIGTAKPNRREIYQLLDILDPHETFTAGKFVQLAAEHCADALRKNLHVIVCGGTGLYVRALFENFTRLTPPPPQEERQRLRERLQKVGVTRFAEEQGVDLEALPEADRQNPARVLRAAERLQLPKTLAEALPPPRWHSRRLKFGILSSREILLPRIRRRIEAMFNQGWENEVAELIERGVSTDSPAFRAIGYKEIADLIQGRINREEAIQRIETKTWQYAKRQLTWLRKEPNLIKLPLAEDPSAHVNTICGYIS